MQSVNSLINRCVLCPCGTKVLVYCALAVLGFVPWWYLSIMCYKEEEPHLGLELETLGLSLGIDGHWAGITKKFKEFF